MSVKSEKVTRSKSGKYFFHGLSILSSNLESRDDVMIMFT